MKSVTISRYAYAEMQKEAGGAIDEQCVEILSDGRVTIIISDRTAARVGEHYPDLSLADGVEALFRGGRLQ